MKKMRKKKTLKSLIAVMLVLVLAASGYIVHRSMSIRAAKEKAAAEAQAAEEAQRKAEEEAAKEAQEAAIASHVYSHRGSEGPDEHSFKAYDAAIAAGSRYIEQDVVCSSDGVLYVSHDLNAVTMTGYNGMYEYISSETVDGLKTYAGNPVLRLSQVFDKYGKDITYVVELKDGSDKCTKAFEDMVDQYGYSDVIIVQSMYPDVLEELEKKYPDMPKLLVCWSQSAFEGSVDSPFVDILSVKANAGLITEANCKLAHKNGKQFSAWTLNDEESIKRAIDLGVDSYFTNDTPLALSIERDYGVGKR